MNPNNALAPKLSRLLQDLRQQLLLLLNTASNNDVDRLPTLNKVIHRLGNTFDVVVQDQKANPLSDVLLQIEHTSDNLPDRYREIIGCIVALSGHLPWYQRPALNNDTFMAGHVNAQIIGPEGLEVRQDLIVGVTLMRPDLDYPDHQHEPQELYLVLSDGRWRQGNDKGNGDWHTPGLGGLVYNKSNVMHGMKSVATPLIALWCLPLDKPFTPFSAAINTPVSTGAND